jgi:branched-chain amino acid transport system ATP-binding protein
MSLLSVQGLSRHFGGLRAVDDVSFDLPDGGVNAVIGPNGAGKTTLFNLIAGAITPSAGRVEFEGQVITGLPPQRVAARGLIRTFQLVRLFDTMSAEENVRVGCHLWLRGGVWAAIVRTASVRAAERRAAEEARALLDMVGLGARADIAAGALSYGEQRLLEIARAMAARPRLLLLDEPAAGLNAQETTALGETIATINHRGVTVLLIEHDMRLVMDVARHVIVLDFGCKIAEGPPAQIAADPAVIAAYLGDEAAEAAVERADA